MIKRTDSVAMRYRYSHATPEDKNRPAMCRHHTNKPHSHPVYTLNVSVSPPSRIVPARTDSTALLASPLSHLLRMHRMALEHGSITVVLVQQEWRRQLYSSSAVGETPVTEPDPWDWQP